MFDQTEVKHHIQKHILSVLLHQRVARFRDMRAPRVDTNLYSYHLTQLIKSGFVTKTEGGYTLDTKGLVYVDHLSAEKLFVRQQPKIVTMLVIQNGYGDILMYKKWRQPFIDHWTVPFGKIHNEDQSIAAAAQRELREKVGDVTVHLRHAGDCYIRTAQEGEVVTAMLAHVFHATVDEEFALADHLQWVKLHDLERYDMVPAISDVIARTLFRDPFYFEEFESVINKASRQAM